MIKPRRREVDVPVQYWDCGRRGTVGHRHRSERMAVACQDKRRRRGAFMLTRRRRTRRTTAMLAERRRSGATYAELGRKYGLSAVRVRQLIKHNEEEMK